MNAHWAPPFRGDTRPVVNRSNALASIRAAAAGCGPSVPLYLETILF